VILTCQLREIILKEERVSEQDITVITQVLSIKQDTGHVISGELELK
jgi:hypothetical protein